MPPGEWELNEADDYYVRYNVYYGVGYKDILTG